VIERSQVAATVLCRRRKAVAARRVDIDRRFFCLTPLHTVQYADRCILYYSNVSWILCFLMSVFPTTDVITFAKNVRVVFVRFVCWSLSVVENTQKFTHEIS